MLIKLDDTPGQYIFEVQVGDNGEMVSLLTVNYWLANAAIRKAGIKDDDWSNPDNQPELVTRVAAAARPTLRPKHIVDTMTDADVFARVNMAGWLDRQTEKSAGEEPEPSPTSRRPMESSSSPGA